MKTKSKTFARKLTALFLAAIMAISCFMGTVTAFAKSTDDYHDRNLAYNFMAWAEASDNQTCEALLDWADLYMGDLLKGLLGTDHIYFSQNVVVTTITIDAYLDSIDGVIDLLSQANGLLSSYGGIIGGDVKNLDLSPLPGLAGGYATQGNAVISKCGKSYRAKNDAKDIVMALAKTLYVNSNDNGSNKNVLGQFIKGSLNLGSILEGVIGGNVYDLLKDALHMWDGYQSNLVYNIVANLIFENTDWYTEQQANSYREYLKNKNNGTRWNFDEQLLDKLSTEFLQKINIDITYDVERNTDPDVLDAQGNVADLHVTDDSKAHYEQIKAAMKNDNKSFYQASVDLGYDPNLHYTDDGNVYLFQYGYPEYAAAPATYPRGVAKKVFTIDKNVTVVSAVFQALEIAWNTALKDTMNLIHVNYSNWENDQKGLSTNFDNSFFYWMNDNLRWNKANWKANYTQKNIHDWAEDVALEYGWDDPVTGPDDFLAQVEKDVTLSRKVTAEEGETPSWRNIDATRLFMKLRYSPLADLAFNVQTGPINLYITETGYSNLKDFMDTAFTTYSGIVPALNDALVAAVYDFFPQSDNIGIQNPDGSITNIAYPELGLTGNTTNKTIIASTLVSNFMKIFEYAANTADLNILNPYYTAHNISTYGGNLDETNFEEAMIPMLIACVTQIDMLDPVHPEAWDLAKDAEGVAYIALREYLSYVLPEKNYDQLITTANGKYEAGVDLNGDGRRDIYTDVILPMARDAVGYLLNSIVPCRKPDGSEWNVYKSDLMTDSTTIFDILNSVVCYYGSMETFREPDGTTTKGKGVAALLGCVDGSGNCTVKLSNSLWQNINAISNKLMPVFGTMQYGTTAKAGQSSSQEIIYDTIVMGLLDIGSVNPHSGKRGITTILEQVLTICTSPTVQDKSALIVIYDDILASLFNNILGARDSRQGYHKVVPYSADYGSSSSTPFDSLVQESTLGEFESGTGVLGVAISNIYEFFGGNMPNYSTQAMADGCWQGAMFAVNAVNNFIPSFVPQLSEHKFNAATMTLDTPSEKVVAGTARNTVNIKFNNNCRGLNRFYKGDDGQIHRSPRYFIRMKNISYALADGSSISNVSTQLPTQRIVAPEQYVSIPVSGSNVAGTQLIKFEVTYDIFEGEYDANGNLPSAPANDSDILYPNLKTSCYLYLTTEDGWVDTTFADYDENTGLRIPGENVYDDSMFTNIDIGDTYMFNDIIISTADPAQVNSYAISTEGIDGVMALDNVGNAYASIDAKTGDLLNRGRVDYKLGNGAWQRGTTTTIAGKTVYNGYTTNDIQSIADNAQSTGTAFATRPHIALTLSEAGNLVKSVKMDGNNYSQVTVDKRLITGHAVSASTPTHGIYFLDLRGKSGAVQFMAYDGTTGIKADDYNVTTVAYSGSTESDEVDLHLIFANDAEAISLQRTYEDYIKQMAPYQATDFEDYNSTYGSSDTNDNLQNSFQLAVEALSKPITLNNAADLVSTMVTTAKTNQTAATMGDVAYKPIPSTVALTGDIADIAVAHGGYWYVDAAHTLPIYMHEELTAEDVVNGADKAGTAVIYNEDDHKYHVATAPKYKYEWTLKYSKSGVVYPYREKTTEQDVWGEGDNAELQYLDTQYEYHMSDSTQVSSGDNWVYKYAITQQTIKENDTNDYRGYYQKMSDSLAYYVEQARKNIDTSLVSQISEGVIEARKNMNNVNFEVASYERMVKVAKEAEKLVYVDGQEEDGEGNKVDVYSTTASSVEIREAKRQYDKFYAIAQTFARGYKGDKLEAEILCASGIPYTNLSATTVEDADGNITSATIRRTNSTAAKYGTYVNNVLTNQTSTGEQAYTDASWNAYVTELAKSVKMAEEKTTAISGIYTQKSALAIAENNLTEPGAATTFNVSGQVTIATNAQGTEGGAGIKAIVYAGTTRLGSTADDGTFSFDVDLGATTLRFAPVNRPFESRTVSVAGDADIANAEIPVNAYDITGDGAISSTDVVAYCDSPFDINGDDAVNDADGAIFKDILRSGVNFGSLVLE